ncbi:MAG TPA: pyridoxamine 5'-phosphate oxidase family protein [Williamwhitmania sp.]|nr:pyridoxamine 5'-phosphate oxidase family protein [Williamwhitmania sp.]
MAFLDPRVLDFINEHYVLTLATSFEEEPYCASCFYVFLPEENSFIFTSDKETRHIRDASHNIFVAGTVHLDAINNGNMEGIQFQGILIEPTGDLYQRAKKAYVERFPNFVIMNTTLWVIDLTFLKMTNNKFGVGNKIIWKKL